MKTLEEVRGYGLGERNPRTLPDGTKNTETWAQCWERDAHWSRIRRTVETERPGRKYYA